jgi:hypothetical protein
MNKMLKLSAFRYRIVQSYLFPSYIVDVAIASFTGWFQQLKKFEKVFGFLFNSENVKSLDDTDVESFSHENKCDVELDDLSLN